MKALDLKLARDLWRMRAQIFAIAIVLAAATATFVLSTGVHRSLTETRDAYYARNNFADVFSNLTRAPRGVLPRIANIPGVRRAEGEIQQYATLDIPGTQGSARALINSVDESGGTQLNRVTLRTGRFPRPGEPADVVIDEAFAEANALAPGDEFAAVIHGVRQRLRVVGIGLAPNYIYALPPGDLIPDESRFGIMWMGRKALEAATDRTEAFNALSLTLERGASEAEVIRKVDTLLAPYGGAGAYGREDHPSHAFLDNELMQLAALTQVIPPVFLLVSGFLVYIVLGRMIRTERTQIGLVKAFGYSDWEIAWHYIKFALVIAVLAIILGAIAGAWIGKGMTELYARYYRFPFLTYSLSAEVFLGASALSIGAAVIGAAGGVRTAVSLTPAVAMSPPPPPVYRSGAVERLGRSAGFTAIGNMMVRHIVRWPWRSAITVFGVALSMSLLFATLQFVDASRAMLDSYFFRTQRQDLTVSFVEPRNEAVLHELANMRGVLRVEPIRALPVKIGNGSRIERAGLEISGKDSRLTAHIDGEGNEIDLPPGGLMLSRQLADKLGVRAGDQVLVEALAGRRLEVMLPVSRIVDEFVGERAYAPARVLDRLARDASPAGGALLKVDPAMKERILARLADMPGVLGVTERNATLERFEKLIDDNMLTMLGFYISFASAIAVGVVYNSARILFSERAHELATLRVLGFHRSEVAIVILGELAILIVLAVPFGSLLGYWLAQLMTSMFSSDLFRLPFAPSRASYGWSILIVLAAATVTALAVTRRVLALDMVRVLKARE